MRIPRSPFIYFRFAAKPAGEMMIRAGSGNTSHKAEADRLTSTRRRAVLAPQPAVGPIADESQRYHPSEEPSPSDAALWGQESAPRLFVIERQRLPRDRWRPDEESRPLAETLEAFRRADRLGMNHAVRVVDAAGMVLFQATGGMR